MYEPKVDIYTLLKDITGVETLQRKPKAFTTLPAITFFVLNNNTNKLLDNTIVTQNVVVQIDIWADKSTECVTTLKTVEGLMRNNYFTLRFSQDFDDPSGLYRITTRFEKLKEV